MTNFNSCQLTLKFRFGKTNDDYMNLMIVHNHSEYSVFPDSNDCATFQVDLNLPDSLLISVSNKNQFDTIVDKNGNIAEDRFVQLYSAHLDGFELNHNFLHKKIKLITTENNEVISSYFGFNGSVTLNFDEPNVFRQVPSCNGDI